MFVFEFMGFSNLVFHHFDEFKRESESRLNELKVIRVIDAYIVLVLSIVGCL